jgi:hypothetical protein
VKWRLSTRDGPLVVALESVCRRPACAVREVKLTLRLAVHDPKPVEVKCPLCGATLHAEIAEPPLRARAGHLLSLLLHLCAGA